jgi:hypothetical protein
MANVILVGGPLDGSVTPGDEAIRRGDRVLIVELDDGRMGAYTCASAADSRQARDGAALQAVWSGPL